MYPENEYITVCVKVAHQSITGKYKIYRNTNIITFIKNLQDCIERQHHLKRENYKLIPFETEEARQQRWHEDGIQIRSEDLPAFHPDPEKNVDSYFSGREWIGFYIRIN